MVTSFWSRARNKLTHEEQNESEQTEAEREEREEEERSQGKYRTRTEEVLPLWRRVRRVTVIGVHGWAVFGGLISTQPSGISERFCRMTTHSFLSELAQLRCGDDAPVAQPHPVPPLSVAHETTLPPIPSSSTTSSSSSSSSPSPSSIPPSTSTLPADSTSGEVPLHESYETDSCDIYEREKGDVSDFSYIVSGKGPVADVAVAEIALASFGKINTRLKKYLEEIEVHHGWIRDSDVVLLAAHSQGTVVGGLILGELLKADILSFDRQFIGSLAMVRWVCLSVSLFASFSSSTRSSFLFCFISFFSVALALSHTTHLIRSTPFGFFYFYPFYAQAGVHHGPYPDLQRDGAGSTKELFTLSDVGADVSFPVSYPPSHSLPILYFLHFLTSSFPIQTTDFTTISRHGD